MTWTDLQRTSVDVLDISSPEKISVRLHSLREEYFKFQDSLRIYCSENSADLQRLQLDPELDPDHCLVRRMSTWHRGLVLSTRDQVRQSWCKCCLFSPHYLNFCQVVVRVRLVDAGKDQDFEAGDLYTLPRKFSLEEKGSFAEFVHLSQFPFSASQSCEMVESIRDIMSEVSAPYYIKRSHQLQFIEDRWSLAVELGWTETRVDTPLGPAYERETFLSQILSKKGFAFVEEAEEEFEEPGGVEDGAAISSLGEDNIDEASEDSPTGDPWCSTKIDDNGYHVGGGPHFGYCSSDCLTEKGKN